MLLQPNKVVQLRVGTASVRASLRTRKAPHKMLAQVSEALTPASSPDGDALPTPTHATPRGHAMDAVLQQLLGTHQGDRTELYAVVADCCAHVDVVKGDFSDSSDHHLDAIANACIAEILGHHAEKQLVRWQLQTDQQHLLISSMEEKEVAAILEVAVAHQLKVRSIQPDFFLQWNAYAAGRQAATCVFAMLNEGYATVAFAQRGVITCLSCGPCLNRDGDASDGLPGMQCVDERSMRLLSSIGQAPDAVTSFVLVTPDPQPIPGGSRWTAMPLSEDSP